MQDIVLLFARHNCLFLLGHMSGNRLKYLFAICGLTCYNGCMQDM